jgi:hypothetical protein
MLYSAGSLVTKACAASPAKAKLETIRETFTHYLFRTPKSANIKEINDVVGMFERHRMTSGVSLPFRRPIWKLTGMEAKELTGRI